MTPGLFETPAAWDASALRADGSWTVYLTDAHRAELLNALAHFKDVMQARGMTAQWLHGTLMPPPVDFPLPTLGAVLRQARADLESRFGLVLLRGVPVAGQAATVVFDQTVTLTGLPGWGIDILGADVVDAQRTQPNTVVLTFSNSIVGAAQLTIPFEDPAIRNQFGGYVADTLYLLA